MSFFKNLFSVKQPSILAKNEENNKWPFMDEFHNTKFSNELIINNEHLCKSGMPSKQDQELKNLIEKKYKLSKAIIYDDSTSLSKSDCVPTKSIYCVNADEIFDKYTNMNNNSSYFKSNFILSDYANSKKIYEFDPSNMCIKFGVIGEFYGFIDLKTKILISNDSCDLLNYITKIIYKFGTMPFEFVEIDDLDIVKYIIDRICNLNLINNPSLQSAMNINIDTNTKSPFLEKLGCNPE